MTHSFWNEDCNNARHYSDFRWWEKVMGLCLPSFCTALPGVSQYKPRRDDLEPVLSSWYLKLFHRVPLPCHSAASRCTRLPGCSKTVHSLGGWVPGLSLSFPRSASGKALLSYRTHFISNILKLVASVQGEVAVWNRTNSALETAQILTPGNGLSLEYVNIRSAVNLHSEELTIHRRHSPTVQANHKNAHRELVNIFLRNLGSHLLKNEKPVWQISPNITLPHSCSFLWFSLHVELCK